MDKGFIGTIIGGITVISVMYILLQHSAQTGSVAKGFTGGYGKVAKTFQGTPGV